MFTIFRREIAQSMSSLLAYVSVVVFLIVCGLLLWIYPDSSLLEGGYASMQVFFNTAPFIFLFLVPAITMRLFAEEKKSGTLELLLTRPLSEWQIILGKYLSACFLVWLTLLPTLLYVYSLYRLADPQGNIDGGAILGSYIGLLLLGAAFSSIGIFASSFSGNQVVSFLVAVFLCYLSYGGFEAIAKIISFSSIDLLLIQLGISAHYESISRGVLDMRDFFYFASFSGLFLFFTLGRLHSRTWVAKGKFFSRELWKSMAWGLFVIIGLIVGNALLSRCYVRFDFTSEHRFSLSASTKRILKNLQQPVHVRVYLEGNMPAGFKRLRQTTREMLDEFAAYTNGNLQVDFQNPLGSDEVQNDAAIDSLAKRGITPINLQVNAKKGSTQKLVFPAAYISAGSRALSVDLLQNQNQTGGEEASEEVLNHSVETLEYQLISAIHKVSTPTIPGIGFLAGNQEYFGPGIADIVTTLKKSYSVSEVSLPSVPESELLKLKLLILVKPLTRFTEPEKYKLDQYIMYGGKILFMIDNLNAELDSMRARGSTLGIARQLNLDDFFFKYGVRVNYDLIEDLNCAPIPVLTGASEQSNQQSLMPWLYYPIVMPPSISSSPLVRNIDPLRLEFSSTIDTIAAKGIHKTILLTSSPYTRVKRAPVYISLADIGEGADTSKFHDGTRPVAVLLEGKFKSLFLHRSIDSADQSKPFLGRGLGSALLVVSDGDVIKNQMNTLEHSIYPLGFDKYTRQVFGNKVFIQNSIDYLASDSSLIQLRGKQLKLRLLNKQLVEVEKLFWQMFNTMLPILIVCVLGFVLSLLRRRRYSQV